MSQVKNLRAMFEQKGDSSPPDRGRAQQGLPTQPAESPRPLSRVRTSFVTVEKDGRVGLQRDPSSDSIPTLARTISAGTESDVAVPAVPQEVLPAKVEDAKLPNVTQTPKRIPASIPEETTHATPAKTEALAASQAASAKPAPDATPKPEPPAAVKVSAPTPVHSPEKASSSPAKAVQRDKSPAPTPRKLFVKPAATAETQPTTPKKNPDAPTNGATKSTASKPAARPAAAPKEATNGTNKDIAVPSMRAPAASSSVPLRPRGTSTSGKEAQKTTSSTKSAPKAISTHKANTKPSVKSPGAAHVAHAAKTPTSPAKPATAKLPSKMPDRKAHTATEKTTAAPKATTKSTANAPSAPSTSSMKGKPAPVATFPTNGIGFVKPKPKSPTRPMQLPSSLMTHTASSATKINVPRQSLSRQSGSFLALHPPAPAVRSPSRTSVSTVGTTAAAGTGGVRPLRRQSSTVSRPRPSIGPPPKQAARDHPVSKKEKEMDEGFLARMMRPTQASALKTADKAHLSPPRKQHAAVATTRKSIAPRESLTAAPVKKAAVKAPSPVPPPSGNLTQSPAPPVTPVKEVAENTKDVEAVPVVEPATNASAEPLAEPVTEAAIDKTVEKEAVVEDEAVEAEIAQEHTEEVVEQAASEEEEEPAVAETPIEEEEHGLEESVDETDAAEEEGGHGHEESVEEPAVVEAAVEEDEHEYGEPVEEPSPEPGVEQAAEEPTESVNGEVTLNKEIPPVHMAEANSKMVVEDSDASAVEISVAAQ